MRRDRLFGLLGIAVALVIDQWLTDVLKARAPEIVKWFLALGGGAPADADVRRWELFVRYGPYLAVLVGWGGTFAGGIVAGAIARRRRIEHALVFGVLSAAPGLVTAFAMYRGQAPAEDLWLFLKSMVQAVPVAGLGGALSLVAFGRRRRDADRPGPEGPGEVAAAAASMGLGEGAGGDVRRASFHGAGGDLFGIHIVNVFLTLLTVGFYRFWARVRVRKFLYAHTEFEGDRFAFHGTGREAFAAWSRGMAIVGAPLLILQLLEHLVESVQSLLVLKVLGFAVTAAVVPIAIAGAWRYRLSRTEWRGIRFSFRGRPARAIGVWLGALLLTGLSLGLAFPLVQVNMHRFLVQDSYFGTRRFAFDGRAGDLVGRWTLFLLLVVVIYLLAAALLPFTFGLSFVLGGLLIARLWFGYSAFKQRYLMAHTWFDTARFRSTVTPNGLFALNLVNALLVVCTLGLGVPWAQVRSMRYWLDHLAVEGPLDLAAIEQDARAASTTGEGLADVLDADVLDVGIGV